MFVRTFRPDRFLRSVYGTEPFVDYCRDRHIPFLQTADAVMQAADVPRWTDALRQLPAEQQVQVELELAKVNELSGRSGLMHLLEALGGALPPPATIPDGAPLALWFLLHHPQLFHEVFLHEEIREVDSWRMARAPPSLTVADPDEKVAALAVLLKEFFQHSEGTGQFCTVAAHSLRDGLCFVVYLADRLQLLDGFTDRGEHTTQRLRPALPITFVYYPDDGTLLLQCRVRARNRLLDLVQRFGQAVLGVELAESCLGDTYDLDRLKNELVPLPDREDMEQVRVKALHLRYPEHAGRRHLKLETRAGDEATAIPQLLRAHLGNEAIVAHLRVSYAELQIRLRVEGRTKNYVVRLWPDRSNLSQTPLGFRFRTCLKRWGLLHVRES